MRPKLPIELVHPPERKIKDMALGERVEIPFYSLYVTDARRIYINLDQRLRERCFDQQMVEIERLPHGFRLYLPMKLDEKAQTTKASYLRIPWRWMLGIKPVLEIRFKD